MLCAFYLNDKKEKQEEKDNMLFSPLFYAMSAFWSQTKLKMYQKCEQICRWMPVSLFFIKMETWK